MKTKLAFLQTIAFVLPLALGMPLSAPAQGTGESKPRQPGSPEIPDGEVITVSKAILKAGGFRVFADKNHVSLIKSGARGEAAQTNENEQVFNFPGGTPRDFLRAVEEHFKVDWLSIAYIPDEMQRVEIPKLRLMPNSLGYHVTGNQVTQLVDLYNRLAERSPQLGNLVVQGDPSKPAVVMLVPNQTWEKEQPKIKVKAFPVWELSDALKEKLAREIDRAGMEALEYAAGRRAVQVAFSSLEGSVAMHKDTGLLVAMGPDSYVDMVESIVAAFRGQAAPGNRPRSGL